MDEEKKEIKVSKSYSFRPSHIKWLRQQAQRESTPEKDVSASAVLERIIDEAMKRTETQSPSEQPKRRKTDARSTHARVAVLAA